MKIDLTKERENMKWDNDEYKELKYEIMDILIKNLSREYAISISLKELCDNIDELFISLRRISENRSN